MKEIVNESDDKKRYTPKSGSVNRDSCLWHLRGLDFNFRCRRSGSRVNVVAIRTVEPLISGTGSENRYS